MAKLAEAIGFRKKWGTPMWKHVWLVFFWFVTGVILGAPVAAGPWDSLAGHIGQRDSVLVADPRGKILFSKNGDTPRVPASTLKVFTALMARHYLGDDFRFRTEVFRTPEGHLVVKGYGDPLLISEVVGQMAAEVAQRVEGFGDLILDDRYFGDVNIPGVTATLNPYDAPNGALGVNFNTVNFATVGGRYASAEPQTPLLPVVLDRIRGTGLRKGRVVLPSENGEALRYAGHLIRHFLLAAGARTQGSVRVGRVDPRQDQLVYRFLSPYDLDAVIQRLLEYSNNFIANQLFITVGVQAYGPPGTLEKGRRAAHAYAADVLGIPGIQIREGSGISRDNRVTARQMRKILEVFAPHYRLMKREGREWFKTGSLSGVKTRVGYVDGPDGLYWFVVLINTPGRGTGAAMRALHRAIPDASETDASTVPNSG